MRLLRIGLGSINSTVGAVRGNVERAAALCRAIAADGASVAALPEQMIGGYPPEDLVLWPGFVHAQLEGAAALAVATAELPSIIVFGLLVPAFGEVYNCAAVLFRGRVLGVVPKEKLPLYNVFYEARTLARGRPGLHAELELGPLGRVPMGDLLFQCDFGTLGVEVCEDLWSADGPLRRRAYHGAELVVNVSASPFRIGVCETRRELVCTRAADRFTTLAYVNAVGANDGLIFDGGGFVSQNGRLLLDAPRFTEGHATVTLDLDRTRRLRSENTTWRLDREDFLASGGPVPRTIHVPGPGSRAAGSERPRYPVPPHQSFFLPPPAVDASGRPLPSARAAFCEELLDAMALGIGDYFEKTRAFKQIGVALSGGRDSLLCLLLAHRYLTRNPRGQDKAAQAARVAATLRAFYMPTRFSSQKTRYAAEVTARELGVPFTILSIDEAFAREEEAARAMLQPGEALTPLTLQNIQSRLRAQRMWNWSNATAGLFLQTGNMSEKAVGYTTIGGDLMGALAPISNLPKTVVNYLLDYLLETEDLEGIRATLVVPASAELAPNQEDERDLMPYGVLDACLALYASEKLAPPEIADALATMFPNHAPAQLAAWVDRFVVLFSRSIYKWVQSPLSLHLGNLDLERERALQLPVVMQDEWQGRAKQP